MTTATHPDIDLIIEGILDARTIADDVKLRLLNELKTEGPTGAVMEKVDALFAAEITQAETEMGEYIAMLPRLEADLTAAEQEALPAMIASSIEFRAELQAIEREEKGKVTEMERSLDTVLRTSSDQADTDEAAAIRKSLGLE